MRTIRASEISSYLYCQRAWWYLKRGQPSANQAEMLAGSELHYRHGRTALATGCQRTIAYALLLLAIILITIYLVSNSIEMPTLAFLLAIVAIALLLLARRQQKTLGLPAGRVIYTDTRAWGAPLEQALYDAELGLTGRPDYLVDQNGKIIPVEVKSSRVGEAPYDTHIYQLAAYCVLVERSMGKRPPYGILHYPNRTFAIDFTPQLENTLLDLLAEMRQAERRKELPRSHDAASRCRACGYRETCEQRLV